MFTEKLLAPTVAEAEELVAAADAAGVALVVSLPRLYHGVTLAVDDVLAAGALGTLTYGRVRLSHDGATAGWLPERFYDPATAVGGALTDLGCHPVYLVQRWLGARPERVSATYRSRHRARGRGPRGRHGRLRRTGAIGVIETGFVSRRPVRDRAARHRRRPALRRSARRAADLRRRGVERRGPSRPTPRTRSRAGSAHMRAGTRADDNLARAVELTRLVVAANEAAASGRAVAC